MTKKYLIASLISVLVILIGVSFAFFTTRIIGNGTNMTLSSKDLKVIFTDSAALSYSNIRPGWSTSKTFTLQNLSGTTYTYNITIKDLINTIVSTGNFQYKIESTNSGYSCDWTDVPKSQSAANKTLAYSATIATGVTQTYTFHLRYKESNSNQSEDMGKSFSGKISIEKGTHTLVDKLLELNPTRLTRASFSDVLTSDNTGTLYTTTNTEDGSTVYYFAGNALNNWVKFGKCTNSSYNCTVGDDLYWRIIRTNTELEDGGVRLLYAGSGSVANTNAYINSGDAYKTSLNDPMYVGYMYGTTGSLANNRTNQNNKSNAATAISSWYTATFNNNSDNNTKDSSGTLLTNYISPTAIYCNDRSVGSGTYNTGSTAFNYAGRTRLESNKAPSLACGANTSGYGNYFEGTSSIADKFTGSAKNSSNVTIGNGLLGTTPAALITADEIAFAGGKYNTNASAWYYLNAASTPGSITGTTYWWTMSPYRWYSSNAYVFNVNGSSYPGYLDWYRVSDPTGVLRPVVSLSSDVLWDGGDGSSTSPFEVTLAG